jgi:hypothetical protein
VIFGCSVRAGGLGEWVGRLPNQPPWIANRDLPATGGKGLAFPGLGASCSEERDQDWLCHKGKSEERLECAAAATAETAAGAATSAEA